MKTKERLQWSVDDTRITSSGPHANFSRAVEGEGAAKSFKGNEVELTWLAMVVLGDIVVE